METPIVDPWDAGFTTTGNFSFAAFSTIASDGCSPRRTCVPAGTGTLAETARVFVVTLCMPIAPACTPDPV